MLFANMAPDHVGVVERICWPRDEWSGPSELSEGLFAHGDCTLKLLSGSSNFLGLLLAFGFSTYGLSLTSERVMSCLLGSVSWPLISLFSARDVVATNLEVRIVPSGLNEAEIYAISPALSLSPNEEESPNSPDTSGVSETANSPAPPSDSLESLFNSRYGVEALALLPKEMFNSGWGCSGFPFDSIQNQSLNGVIGHPKSLISQDPQ